MTTKQWFELVISEIDLETELRALGMRLRDEFLYGDLFVPVKRIRFEYTGPERQLTAGTPPRTER